MNRQKIDVHDLVVGMYVAELDRPWLGTPFLFQGFLIGSDDDISQLQNCCRYVYIDTEQSREALARPRFGSLGKEPQISHSSSTKNSPAFTDAKRPVVRDTKSFDAELKGAVEVYRKSRDYINTVFEDARLGNSINTVDARDLASRVVDSVFKNESALVWLTQLKSRDEYTTQHSINVCVLSVLFARHLGLPPDDLRLLGFGALLHDIGKMKVPLEILNKDGKLTDEEMVLMKQHPQLGKEILEKSSGVSSEIIDIAYSHHERIDGSGYPRSIEGDTITLFSKIVSIVDVYDAITSDRVYHMGIAPHEALNLMYGWTPRSFESELLEEFIRCIGIYPIGSIVELDTGEVGVVMTVNRQRAMRPMLTLVLDGEKRPMSLRKMLNLDSMERSGSQIAIRRLLDSRAYGINVRQIIMESQAASAVH